MRCCHRQRSDAGHQEAKTAEAAEYVYLKVRRVREVS